MLLLAFFSYINFMSKFFVPDIRYILFAISVLFLENKTLFPIK